MIFRIKKFNALIDKDMMPAKDPKFAITKANFDGSLEINQTSFDKLIRVLGISPVSVKHIVEL